MNNSGEESKKGKSFDGDEDEDENSHEDEPEVTKGPSNRNISAKRVRKNARSTSNLKLVPTGKLRR